MAQTYDHIPPPIETGRIETEKPNNLSFDVIKKIMNLQTLEECANYAAALIGNPVLILDPAFGILTHSHYEFGWDKGWDDLFRRGEYTYEFLASNFEFDSHHIAELESGMPAVGLNAQSKNRRLVVRMYYKDVLMGHFATIEACCPFSETDLNLASIFAKTAERIIVENRIITHTRKYRSLYPLLIDRIEGIQSNKNEFNRALEKIGYHVEPCYRVLLVDLSNYYIQKRPADSLKDFLNTLSPNTQSFFYNNNILVLLPVKPHKNHEHMFRSLDNTLSDWHLYAAVSDRFTAPFFLPEYYRQARAVFDLIKSANAKGVDFLKKRKPFDSLLFYEDFRFVATASSACAKTKFADLTGLYDDKMIEIMEYDKKYATDNMNTLWIYLNSDKNALMASDEMGIHRNTINYRLRKMEELFALDFTDRWQMFRIYSSYLVFLSIGRN